MTRLVQAELLKLRTTRTARALLALAAAGTAALVAVVLLLAGQPGQPALGDDALRLLVLVPAQPLTLAALVLGILGMAGELRHGTATPTFLVTPRRGRVVAAKLAAAGLTGLAMAVAVLGGGAGRRPALAGGQGDRGRRGRPRRGRPGGRAGRRGGAVRRGRDRAGGPAPQPGRGRGRRPAVVVAGGRARPHRRPGRSRGWSAGCPWGAASALTAPGDGTLPMWAGALVLAAYGLVLALLGGRLLARRDLT